MKFRALSAALLATAIAAGIAPVKAIGQVTGPAEAPPEGFSEAQYVDSNGCVFVRAELGGAVNWVPRMTRERKPVCGMQPTLAAATPAPETAPAAAVPKPAMAAAPATPPAPATTPRRSASSKRAVAAPTQSAPAIQVRCPGNAPVLYQKVKRGKVTIWCGPAQGASAAPAAAGTATASSKLPAPPAGYKYAFDTGQYNPNRGIRTADGEAQMNQVWTRDVPQRTRATSAGTRVSTKLPQTSAQEVARHYVQVGVYGVSSNTQAAISRLQQAGLPVATTRLSSRGKDLDVVLAGPFATHGQAAGATAMARRAGFADAFPRR